MKAMSFGKFFPNIFSFDHRISGFLVSYITRAVKLGVSADRKSFFTKSLSRYADFSVSSRRSVAAVALSVLLVSFACGQANAEAFLINQAISQAVLTNPGVGEAAANRRATESELRQTQGTLLPQVRLGSSIGPEKFIEAIRLPPRGNRAWENGREVSVFVRQIVFDGFASIHEIWRQSARVDASAFRVLERTELIALDAAEAYVDVVRFLRLVALANQMDIVPLDDSLLVEGRIRPQDIAFIRPQQNAVVKLSAYDSSVFGSLEGKVERISADTIADERPERGEKGETFYRVMVRTEKNHLGTSENPFPILPGMLATVEVLTGKKTVLDYLLKPARVLREEALRER